MKQLKYFHIVPALLVLSLLSIAAVKFDPILGGLRESDESSASTAKWTANSAVISPSNDDLFAVYHFSDDALTVDSKCTNKLTKYNVAEYASGKHDYAADFNGSTSYFTIPANLDSFSSGSVTAWVKMKANGDQGTFIGSSANNGWAFEIQAANTLAFSKIGVAGKTSTATITDTTTWHFIAVVWTGSQIKFCVDDSIEDFQAFSYTYAGAGTYGIGNRPSSAEWLNAYMDEFTVYEKPLSDAQLEAMFNATVGSFFTYDKP